MEFKWTSSFGMGLGLAIFALGTLSSSTSRAATNAQGFVYQGRILNAAGTAGLSDTVDFILGIYDPSGNCLLYEEEQANISLVASDGLFSVSVGAGVPPALDAAKRSTNDPAKTMSEVFSNTESELRAAGSAQCAGGYTPQASDVRVLRVTVTPYSTGIPQTLTPDLTIGSTPQAQVAETVQGLTPTQLLQITGNTAPYVLSKSALDVLLGDVVGGATAPAADASGLHNHDSLYARLGAGTNFSGPVGIGSSSPTADLSLGGDTNRAIVVDRNSTTVGTALSVVAGGAASGGADLNGGSLVLSSGTSTGTGVSQIEFKTSGGGTSGSADRAAATRMMIDGNGNVGIGTATPGSKLEVAGGTDITALRTTGTSSGLNWSGRIVAGGPSNVFLMGQYNNQAWLGAHNSALNAWAPFYINPDGNQDLYLGDSDGSALTNTPIITVRNSTGYVGIGTTSPTSPLTLQTDSIGNVELLSLKNTNTGGNATSIGFYVNGTKQSAITSYDNFLYFDSVSASGTMGWSVNNSRKMTLLSGGNLGIGTETPDANLKLQVNGAAASGVNIIATGGAVNLSLANVHYLKAVGSSAITLSNMASGGSYTLVISDTAQRTYTFSGCTNSYFSPANGQTFQQSTYSVLVVVDGADTNCYISWVTGFN